MLNAFRSFFFASSIGLLVFFARASSPFPGQPSIRRNPFRSSIPFPPARSPTFSRGWSTTNYLPCSGSLSSSSTKPAAVEPSASKPSRTRRPTDT